MGKVNRVSNKRFAQTDAVGIEVAHLAAGVFVAIGLILLADVRDRVTVAKENRQVESSRVVTH